MYSSTETRSISGFFEFLQESTTGLAAEGICLIDSLGAIGMGYAGIGCTKPSVGWILAGVVGSLASAGALTDRFLNR